MGTFLSQEKKIKHKPRLKEYKDDEIHKEDDRTFYINEYMIYNSDSKGFLCDCMDFVMNINKDKYHCKHIKRVLVSITKDEGLH